MRNQVVYAGWGSLENTAILKIQRDWKVRVKWILGEYRVLILTDNYLLLPARRWAVDCLPSISTINEPAVSGNRPEVRIVLTIWLLLFL
jgi:hypothetical protein